MNTTNTIVRLRIREIFFFSRQVIATASLRLLRLIGVISLGPATLLSFLFCSLSLAFLSAYARSRSYQSHAYLSHLPPHARHFIHNGRPNRAIKYILHFCFIGTTAPPVKTASWPKESPRLLVAPPLQLVLYYLPRLFGRRGGGAHEGGGGRQKGRGPK